MRSMIEMKLDIPDANHHDWRGMASVMNLNSEEVRRLENDRENGKMKGLFERMIQKHKTVNDLIAWLRHPDVERLDVIDEIRQQPNISDALLKATESSENQLASGLFAVCQYWHVFYPVLKQMSLLEIQHSFKC